MFLAIKEKADEALEHELYLDTVAELEADRQLEEEAIKSFRNLPKSVKRVKTFDLPPVTVRVSCAVVRCVCHENNTLILPINCVSRRSTKQFARWKQLVMIFISSTIAIQISQASCTNDETAALGLFSHGNPRKADVHESICFLALCRCLSLTYACLTRKRF